MSSSPEKPQLPKNKYTVNPETLELNLTSKSANNDIPAFSESQSIFSENQSPACSQYKSGVPLHSSEGGSDIICPPCENPAEIESTFQRFNILSHPNFSGLRNAYPHHKPMERLESDAGSDDGRTVLLEILDPVPIPDVLVLQHGDQQEEDAVRQAESAI
jgi:hypothetical protein